MIVTQIANDNHITDFKINDTITSDKNIIGTFVKNSAELTILNLNHTYDYLKNQYIDIKNFGTWYVDDLKTDEEMLSSTLTLCDCTKKFDEDYEDSFSFPATMGEWATWIGKKVGIPLKGTFLNYDLILTERPYIGFKPKYRDAVKKIAKYSASYVQLNYDNTYSIRWLNDEVTEIEDWESFVHGKQKDSINVIVLSTGDTEDNIKFPEKDPSNPHELRIEDDWTNIDRYSINQAIYNQLYNFSYTPISKLDVPFGLLSLRAGQKIKTKDIELIDIETYISTMSLEWQGGEFEDPNAWITSIQMEELNETSTKLNYANAIKNDILRVERKTDKNSAEIEDVIEQSNEQSQKMSQVLQTVEEIKNSISEIADITISGETNFAKLELNKINESEPISLKIRPRLENISYLYPNSGLYPSGSLFPKIRTLRFHNNTTNKNIDYILPDDLLYYNEDIYDEFELDYENQICKITKKVGYNSDGTTYKLSSSQVKNYEYPVIALTEGDYTISLLGYSNAYIFVRLMATNIYTTQFATKIELKSSITQTATQIQGEVSRVENLVGTETKRLDSKFTQTCEDITLEVSKKVGNNEIISKINQSAEKIQILADKISLEGKEINLTSDKIKISSNNFNVDSEGNMTCNSGTFKGKVSSTDGDIGGWTINKNGLTNGKVFINSSGYSSIYTIADYFIVRNYLQGKAGFEFGDVEIKHYDFNNDGVVNSSDLLTLRKMTLGY